MKSQAKHRFFIAALLLGTALLSGVADAQFSEQQRIRLLKRFPDADQDGDGRLSNAEAKAYRNSRRQTGKSSGRTRGVPREFPVNPGWQADRFPEHAVCYRTPEQIARLYASQIPSNREPVVRYPKPEDGSLRIVATGHSFMAPGFKTFPPITKAAGLQQPPLLTHTGGGITGSARYKWEQENGIFEFDREPTPKLLASISNAPWDAMVWGPYYQDRADYYECWIDFCLRYNPEMKFYLSDAWPQLDQLDQVPESEDELTVDLFRKLERERDASTKELIDSLNDKYPGRVFVLPTCQAMVLAVEHYHRDQLPGIEGIHRFVGGKERSLWSDHLGHLGPGLDRLEGYVFYATVYGRSPELIEGEIEFGDRGDFPSPALDRAFRTIAWQAALQDPLSGVVDQNGNGCCDRRE